MSGHEELRALVQRYARAADERDVEALAALFHPDAVVEGARGRQALGEWLEGMRAPRTFPSSMHFLGDPLIDVSWGAGTVDTYGVVYQLAGEGGTDLTLGVRYVDEVEVFDGRWVIRHRRASTLWTR